MDSIQHVCKGQKYRSSLTTTKAKLSFAFHEIDYHKHFILTYLIIYRTNHIMQFIQIYPNKSLKNNKALKLFTTTKQLTTNY